MTQAQEANAFIEYGTKAREEHITYTDNFVPGFVAFTCDVDVYVGIWGKTLHKGTYFLSADDVNKESGWQNAVVYTATPDEEQVIEQAINAGDYDEIVSDDGTLIRAIRDTANLNLTVKPVELESGHYLYFLEFIAWLAINVAESDEIRDAIFNSAYRVEVKRAEPKQTSRRATRRYDPITKLHQNLSNPALYSELGVELNLAGRGEKKKGRDVTTLVALEYVSDGEGVELTRQLSEFDVQVYNALCSLFEAEKENITPQEVFEMTMGGKGKAKREQLDKIIESVELLRKTKLRADVTKEAKAHGLIDPETGEPWEQMEIDDYLFSAVRATMRGVNGKIMAGYHINSMPIGLKYAKASKQVISYPVKYLDTKSAGSNTERNVVIRGYLLQRIVQAKNGKMSNTIRCDTIYDKAGINKASSVERGRVNKYMTNLLELWKKQELINGYEVISEGRRQMAKIVVTFPGNAIKHNKK